MIVYHMILRNTKWRSNSTFLKTPVYNKHVYTLNTHATKTKIKHAVMTLYNYGHRLSVDVQLWK